MNATNASNALKAPNEVSAGFSIARFLRSILREYLVVVAIVWLVLITVVVEPNFMTPAGEVELISLPRWAANAEAFEFDAA